MFGVLGYLRRTTAYLEIVSILIIFITIHLLFILPGCLLLSGGDTPREKVSHGPISIKEGLY